MASLDCVLGGSTGKVFPAEDIVPGTTVPFVVRPDCPEPAARAKRSATTPSHTRLCGGSGTLHRRRAGTDGPSLAFLEGRISDGARPLRDMGLILDSAKSTY
jgi:hypothetical protein